MSALAEQYSRYQEARSRLWGKPPAKKLRPSVWLVESKKPEEPLWGAPVNLIGLPSARLIIKLVALKHGVDAAEMVGPSRAAKLVKARDHALGLVYSHCRALSLPQLGALFGGRDHTTILHALRKMRLSGANFYRRANGNGKFALVPVKGQSRFPPETTLQLPGKTP